MLHIHQDRQRIYHFEEKGTEVEEDGLRLSFSVFTHILPCGVKSHPSLWFLSLLYFLTVPRFCFPIAPSVPGWSSRGHTLSTLPSLRALQPDNPAACCPPRLRVLQEQEERHIIGLWSEIGDGKRYGCDCGQNRVQDGACGAHAHVNLHVKWTHINQKAVYTSVRQWDPAVWSEVIQHVWSWAERQWVAASDT